jgi:lipopolysaccharide biosynthesis glycosyltransferase
MQILPQYQSIRSTLYRILIASLLPVHLEKVIYLDSDLCVLKSLSGLWNIDIGENFCIACVPAQQPFLSGDYILTLPLDRGKRYFDNGVQLINLKNWRRNNIERQLLKGVMYYDTLLVCKIQDILNIVLKNRIYPLAHSWNAMPGQIYALEPEEEEAFSDPCVMHWAGWQKPWIYNRVKYSDIFFRYARMSPFYEDILFENYKFRTDFEVQKSKRSWFLQKLHTFKACRKDHGLLYTLGLFLKKCFRRVKKLMAIS